MIVKPAKGRLVRWPGNLRPLSTEGEEVPDTSFWKLCLINGDVVEVPPLAPTTKPILPKTQEIKPNAEGNKS